MSELVVCRSEPADSAKVNAGMSRDEGRAWVRVTLVKSAQEQAEEERRIERLKYEARALPRRIRRLRRELEWHEQRARELGIEA